MKFSMKEFFSKCDQIRSFLWIWSHLLKKCLMENFIFLWSYLSKIFLIMQLKTGNRVGEGDYWIFKENSYYI